MFSRELCDRTLILLKHRDPSLTLQKIADETGLKKRWLEKFVADNIVEPGASKVETLYVFLTGKRLELEPKELNL